MDTTEAAADPIYQEEHQFHVCPSIHPSIRPGKARPTHTTPPAAPILAAPQQGVDSSLPPPRRPRPRPLPRISDPGRRHNRSRTPRTDMTDKGTNANAAENAAEILNERTEVARSVSHVSSCGFYGHLSIVSARTGFKGRRRKAKEGGCEEDILLKETKMERRARARGIGRIEQLIM